MNKTIKIQKSRWPSRPDELHLAQAALAVALSIGLTGCLELPGFLRTASGRANRIAKEFAGASDSDQATIAGTLAITEDIISSLKISLKELGLTEQQLQAVEDSARREVQASVVAIQTGSMSLTVDMVGTPIEYAVPAVMRGAVIGLSAIGTQPSALTLKNDAVKTVVGTGFKNMRGRVNALPPQAVENMAINIAGGAVSKLTEAGYTPDTVAGATKAVTSGGIASLKEAGIPASEISNVAKVVVSGSVAQLSTINLPPEKVAAAVGGVTEGAVAAIKDTGLDASGTAQLAGSLTAASVVALVALKNVGDESLVAAMKQISTSAVSALKEAKVNEDTMLSAVNSISSASTNAVLAVTESGAVNRDVMKAGVSAITSGAISGLSTLVSESNTTLASSAASSIVGGSMTALAESSKLAANEKVNIVVDVVSKSVAEVSALGSATGKTNVISSVIGKTMESLDALGVAKTAEDTATTLKAVSTSATAALASSGFTGQQLATVVSEAVVGSLVKGIDSLKVSSGTNLGGLVSSVMTGVASGVDTLKSEGKTTANEAVAAISAASQSATDKVSDLKVASTLSSTEIASITESVVTATPPSVTYAVAAVSLTIGNTMEPLVPTVSGKFTDCTVSPSLPTGLDIATSCRISGTPSAVTPPTIYTIRPNNSGLATLLTIGVAPIAAQPGAGGHAYYQQGLMLSNFGTGAQVSSGFQGWVLGVSPAKINAGTSTLTSGYSVRK